MALFFALLHQSVTAVTPQIDMVDVVGNPGTFTNADLKSPIARFDPDVTAELRTLDVTSGQLHGRKTSKSPVKVRF